MKHILKPSFRFLSLVGLAMVVGCGSMSKITPGTPLRTVVSQYGQPSVDCQNPDGSKRVVWAEQPAGQQAWAANVDANGGVSEFNPVLTNEQFSLLSQGAWDTYRVNCHFGPPAKIKNYPNNENQVVWQYHFITGDAGRYQVLSIDINKASNRVAGYSMGPNPERNPLFTGS